MTDIVGHLRQCATTIYEQAGDKFRFGLQNEAADEIERLRADNKRLRDRMEKVSDVLYDKGEMDAWAAVRNALWQDNE